MGVRSMSERVGTSLAVRQFMEIIRRRHLVTDRIALRVESLTSEYRKCVRCCDVRLWDVAVGVPVEESGERGVDELPVKLAVGWCRVCGMEVWSNG